MREPTNKSLEGDYHHRVRDLDPEDLEIMHLPPRYWGAVIDEIPEETRCREVLNKLTSDIPSFMRDRNKPSLILFSGAQSCGKTSAATVLAKAVRSHRFTVLFLDVAAIPRLFLSDNLTNDDDLKWRDRAYMTDLLILDGLGRGYEKVSFAVGEIEALLKHRQDNLLRTVVTTDMVPDHIRDTFGSAILHELSRTAVAIDMNTTLRSATTGELIDGPA